MSSLEGDDDDDNETDDENTPPAAAASAVDAPHPHQAPAESRAFCQRTSTARHHKLPLISPPGVALPPVGLCFTDVTLFCIFFFKFHPCHSTTGGRIATRIVALTPSMKY